MKYAIWLFRLYTAVFLANCTTHKSARSFEGWYCSRRDLSSSCYHLFYDRQFEYFYGGCLGSEKGQGHYKITGDSIHFYFEPVVVREPKKIIPQKLNSDVKERLIQMHITVQDDPFSPAVGCHVSLMEDGQVLKEMLADRHGNVSLQIPGTKAVKIIITYPGCQPAQVDVEASGSYTLAVELGLSNITPVPPHTMIYRLIKWNAHSITLGSFYNQSKFTLTAKRP